MVKSDLKFMNITTNVQKTKDAYRKMFLEYTSNNNVLRPVVKKMLDYFVLKLEGNVVLDVGCASGIESEYLAKHNLKVTGVDISEEFIKLAKKKCPDCIFLVGDMRELNLGEESFDGIWASASFLHIPKEDAAKTLSNFRRMLKGNGLLYLSVMEGNFNSLRENLIMKWPERHFSDYTIDELEGLLKKSGFTIFKKESVKTDWGPTFLHFFANKKSLTPS